jgi:prepilin-type N-terminal cleavage/methylation domain-containing protein/prepilin-type processing-associated H-X9-DG protein
MQQAESMALPPSQREDWRYSDHRVIRSGVGCSGFTLIELLVVIAIIAVLATLGIGASRSAIATAASAKCVNNLRQIGAGISMYITDNNGTFPSSSGYDFSGSGAISFGFSHYQAPLPCLLGVGSNKPTTFAARADYDTPKAKHPFNCPSCKTDFRTYAANMHAMAFLPGGNDYKPRKMGSLSNLSQLLLIADNTAGDSLGDKGKGNFSSSDYMTVIGTRHAGRANMLFGDLHVETLSRTTLDASKNIKQQ